MSLTRHSGNLHTHNFTHILRLHMAFKGINARATPNLEVASPRSSLGNKLQLFMLAGKAL